MLIRVFFPILFRNCFKFSLTLLAHGSSPPSGGNLLQLQIISFVDESEAFGSVHELSVKSTERPFILKEK